MEIRRLYCSKFKPKVRYKGLLIIKVEISVMDDEACYRIKRIRFPPWNSNALQIPILLQDVNGPCPLLAIMNVLLLRQAITLPAGAGEVTQVSTVNPNYFLN